MGLVIQSFNFDSVQTNGDKNSNKQNTRRATTTTTTTTTTTNTTAAPSYLSSNKSTNTPLLDNIQAEQIESDHE